MVDLRAAPGPFDADASLTGAPEPWDYLPMPARRDGPPWAMAEMIAAEPALAGRIARRLVADDSAHALAAAIRATTFGGGPVLTTGCGTSEHASLAAAALLRQGWRRAGLPGWGPVSAQAFELSLDAPSDGIVIGCSHEGGTAATIAALDASRAHGARTAVITASAGAPVTASADIVLPTVEMDRSWCHTVGYVSAMIAAAVTADLPERDGLEARAQRARQAGGGGRRHRLQLVTLEVAAARGTNPDPIRRDDPVHLRAADVADAPGA